MPTPAGASGVKDNDRDESSHEMESSPYDSYENANCSIMGHPPEIYIIKINEKVRGWIFVSKRACFYR